MTDTVSRLRELEQAATRGRWRTYHDGIALDGTERQLVAEASDESDYGAVAKWIEPADAALIAATRNVLPLLLDVAAAARRLSDKRTSDQDGYWISVREMRTIDDALAALEAVKP